MATRRPTKEQLLAVEAFQTRKDLKISAFAGAGKTSTLEMIASSRNSRGVYLAFNKSIADEAAQRFPKTVNCRTTHSLAFGAVRSRYRIAKLTKSMSPKQLAAVTGYGEMEFSPTLRLGPDQLASLALRTVKGFCQSSADHVAELHVPATGRLLGQSEEVTKQVKAWAVDEAQNLWSRMTDRSDDLPMGHDGYLKLWALSRPELAAEYVLLDEAQDTNEVVLGVLAHQDAQRVYVGDRHQQIYEWRGAVNAMDKMAGEEVALTMSFRFGPELASQASQVLVTLGESKPLTGNPAIASRILPEGEADALLARTNATVILEVLQATSRGKRAAVVGGTDDLKRLLSDVFDLKAGKPGSCPEFFGFRSWEEVVRFAESEEGESLRTFVQMVETHGERKLWAALKQVEPDESVADLILSTAHKAKGREWDRVRLADDFGTSRLGKDPNAQSEVRLFYVAMTRAKKELIVSTPLLQLYATNAWKSKSREPGKPIQRATAIRHTTPRGALSQTPDLFAAPLPSAASIEPSADKAIQASIRPTASRTLAPQAIIQPDPPLSAPTPVFASTKKQEPTFFEKLSVAIFGKK